MNSILLPTLTNALVTENNSYLPTAPFLLKSFGKYSFTKNILFKEELVEYNENYENDQSNSLAFGKHMRFVYDLLKKTFPKESNLVEVGCGQGAFLEIVKKDAYFNYKGYDQAYKGNSEHIEKRFLTVADSIDADIVVLRHTLEHIESPYNFLKFLQKVFTTKTKIFIEVPQFDWIEKNKCLFDFTYEHVNYFSTKSLCSLFKGVKSFGDLFNGQYQYCLASLNALSKVNDFDDNTKCSEFDILPYFKSFEMSVEKLKNFEKIWIWGVATKGVLFLVHLSRISPILFNRIAGIIDSNPRKHDRLTPITKLKVKSPQVLYDYVDHGDVVVVMNPNYLDEVKDTINKKIDKKITCLSL